MSDNRFQTKFGNIAEVSYQDAATHEWIPVSSNTPLPITGTGSTSGSPLNIRIIGSTGEAADVVQMPDGGYALKVDSELIVNVDNVSIGNIKVGYDLDSGEDTKLATTADGFVRVVDENGLPVTDIRQLTSADKISIYGSDDGVIARLIKTTSAGAIYTIAEESSVQKIKADDTVNQNFPLIIASQNRRIEHLLLKIVQELEKLNLHMNHITDEEFSPLDIETTNILKV